MSGNSPSVPFNTSSLQSTIIVSPAQSPVIRSYRNKDLKLLSLRQRMLFIQFTADCLISIHTLFRPSVLITEHLQYLFVFAGSGVEYTSNSYRPLSAAQRFVVLIHKISKSSVFIILIFIFVTIK